MEDFAANYRKMADDELACVYADRAELIEPAQRALDAELARRGVSSAGLHVRIATIERHARRVDTANRRTRNLELRACLLDGAPNLKSWLKGWVVLIPIALLLFWLLGKR